MKRLPLRKFRTFIFAACFLATLCLLYAYFIEPHAVVITRIDLPTAKFPADFAGLDIVQLSDIHLNRVGRYEHKVIQKTNALNPDLIVVTGDFFDHSGLYERPGSDEFISRLDAIGTFLSQLKAKTGVFVVRGNNDFSNDKEVSDRLLDTIKESGAIALANQRIQIKKDGLAFYLAGVDFAEFDRKEVADFWVNREQENNFLQSGSSSRNSYSHYYLFSDSMWKNYEFTGRMKYTDPDDAAIGVTFYSTFHRGYDRYYRLRRYAERPSYFFSPHGTSISGEGADTGFVPKAGQWHRFKIKLETSSDKTAMRAKVWEQDRPEPRHWQAEAFDSSATRLTAGTVGAWSAKSGEHFFDNLIVINDGNDTLLYEDFEKHKNGADPFNWVDFNRGEESIPILFTDIGDSLFTLLLSHTPDYILEAQKFPVDLMLSGHTHGGQVRLPLIGSPVKRIKIGRKYMQGQHQFDKTTLYVNRGIGTILLPLRFLCRPEITVIRIRR